MGSQRTPLCIRCQHLRIVSRHRYTLTIEANRAEGFAFIAAARKGVESVSAAAIASPKEPSDGLLIYIASNDAIHLDTKVQLQSIVSSLQQVASRGKLELTVSAGC